MINFFLIIFLLLSRIVPVDVNFVRGLVIARYLFYRGRRFKNCEENVRVVFSGMKGISRGEYSLMECSLPTEIKEKGRGD